MRILVAHSRYMTGAVSGENRVVEDEIRLLREAGHHVTVMTPEPVPPADQGTVGLMRTSAAAVWSRGASGRLRDLVRRDGVEVVHLHNLYPLLSPAVIRAAAAENVPVVMTLHNYRLLCLPATLELDGEICERCVGHIPWQGVRFGCYRGSRTGSAVVAGSLTLHRMTGSFSKVSRFLAVSEFVRRKYEEAGFAPGLLRVKPNFSWEGPRRRGPGEYFLFVGRLSREKGVESLVEMWDPGFGRLLIVGSGPEEGRLRSMARTGVEFCGAMPPAAVLDLFKGSRALLVPSIGFETSGRVIMEAYASGVPVIAGRIGALPEAVEDDVSGLLVAPADRGGWVRAIRRLGDDATSVRLGDGAAERWRDRYSPEHGLLGLEGAYATARAEMRS